MLRLVTSGLRANARRMISATIAIVLGVGFLTATLVLGDTMREGFAQAFIDGNDGTAVVVRSETRLGNDDLALAHGTVPTALIDEVTGLPGVAAGAILVEGRAQILASDGSPLGGDGPPTLAANWIDDRRLSPWELAEGRAPVSDAEVVIDVASARRGGLAVGDTTIIRTPDPIRVTVVGTATFAGEDSQGPTTQTLLATPTAQELFLGLDDQASAIRLAAEPGIDHGELAARVDAAVGPGLEAITGAELAAEQLADLESDFIGFFQGLLFVFAAVGLLVATLTIHNTFSITVAQRSRESALLRAIGASRRQIVVSQAAESLAVGAAASVVGLGVGLGLAALALWGMDAGGFGIPGSMSWSTTSLVLAAVVGLVVTVLASVVPTVTASRVAPLATVRDAVVDRSGASRARRVAGLASGAVAIGAVVLGSMVDRSELLLAGLATVSAVAAVVLLGPSLASPVASALGWPIARLRGRVGVLARNNAVRNPRRTASTATALTVGVGVAVLFAVAAHSLNTYVSDTLERTFAGDLVIEADSFSGPGLSSDLARSVAALDDVEVAVAMATGVAVIDGHEDFPLVVDPVDLGRMLDVGWISGSAEVAADGGLAVHRRLADERGWELGEVVEVHLGVDEEPTALTVGGIYADRDLVGDLMVDRSAWGSDRIGAPDRVVVIAFADGADPQQARTAVAAVADAQAAPAPLDRDEYADSVAAEIDQMLMVVFALLAIAVVIAVIGIGNTMSLSIHERTRELGLLRAVGMSRGGVRATVRWESVIVAVFGSIVGLGLGAFGGWATLRAFQSAEDIAVAVAFPVTTMALVVVLAAVAGVVAALRPARRAARLDVLDAIAQP